MTQSAESVNALPIPSAPLIGRDALEQLADDVVKKIGAQEPRRAKSDTGPVDLKKFARKNWLANSLIALIVGSAGAAASYKATEERSVDNEADIADNRKAISAIETEVEAVKFSVENLGSAVKAQTIVQTRMANTVEKLTVESKTREETRLRDRIRQLERRLGRNR